MTEPEHTITSYATYPDGTFFVDPQADVARDGVLVGMLGDAELRATHIVERGRVCRMTLQPDTSVLTDPAEEEDIARLVPLRTQPEPRVIVNPLEVADGRERAKVADGAMHVPDYGPGLTSEVPAQDAPDRPRAVHVETVPLPALVAPTTTPEPPVVVPTVVPTVVQPEPTPRGRRVTGKTGVAAAAPLTPDEA